MSDVVVRVEGLGKEYRLGGRPAYTTLGEQLRNWSPLRGLLGRGRADAPPPFWALKDVSFEVKRGEVVGIIGRNGAGKSTLLKILSRITEPTEGTADIHGRVGSLLEVGTGFHPELTGRENVYLNGAILGMRRSEVRAKFDDIVGFAEVEKFIDTPVKHYSSGMYTRLAFAVAAHLESEILVIDEVLAVGDIEFQRKCLGKMGEVARDGRTVLFVSHNLGLISDICTRGLCLRQGKIELADTAGEVVRRYLSFVQNEKCSDLVGILRGVTVLGVNSGRDGEVVQLEIELQSPAEYEVGIDLVVRQDLVPVLFTGSAYFSKLRIPNSARTRIACSIGPVKLAVGAYQIDVKICKPLEKWVEEHYAVGTFEVTGTRNTTRPLTLRAGGALGYVIPEQQWTLMGEES